jgi:hypothetical protein
MLATLKDLQLSTLNVLFSFFTLCSALFSVLMIVIERIGKR